MLRGDDGCIRKLTAVDAGVTIYVLDGFDTLAVWTDATANPELCGLEAGTYDINVEAAGGLCTQFEMVSIYEPTELVITGVDYPIQVVVY